MPNIDPKQKCHSCGMTRDAHWGPHYLAASVCTGFVSPPKPIGEAALEAARKKIIEEREELLDALATALPYVEGAIDDPAFKQGAVKKNVDKIRKAIAKAEGRVL